MQIVQSKILLAILAALLILVGYFVRADHETRVDRAQQKKVAEKMQTLGPDPNYLPK